MTKYQSGFFKEQPVKDYGSIPRLLVAISRRRPSNGWGWAKYCFERFRWLEVYWPELPDLRSVVGADLPPTQPLQNPERAQSSENRESNHVTEINRFRTTTVQARKLPMVTLHN